MIRRLLRILVTAFCLLSLLVALDASWLWWEQRRGRGYVADGAVLGVYVMAGSQSTGGRIGVMVVRRWPGGAMFRCWSSGVYYKEHPPFWADAATLRTWDQFGISAFTGFVAVYVRQDTGEPVRWYRGNDPDKSILSPSPRMPVWSIVNIPHAAIIVPALAPPLLWAGTRWHRVRERRRRVRLNLCLACGYDPRDSPAMCPECGTVPSAHEKPRRSAGHR
jgi:hypothetical protein